MNKTLALLFTLLFTPAALAAQTVEEFLADPVAVLDERGKLEREIPRKDAPKVPLTVLSYNEVLDLVQVDLGGKKVWFDPLDLRLNPTKIVKLGCDEMKAGQLESKENNSTISYGKCKQ